MPYAQKKIEKSKKRALINPRKLRQKIPPNGHFELVLHGYPACKSYYEMNEMKLDCILEMKFVSENTVGH